MLTNIRRTLTAGALACAVGASTLAMSGSASALTWHSSVKHTVSTWHCTASLVGHNAQTGSGPHVTNYYAASETLTTHQYYQSVTEGPECGGFFQTSTDGGRTWDWIYTTDYLRGAYKTTSTPWYTDDAPKLARACVEEWYTYWVRGQGDISYTSGVRCSAAW
jgi:hypothetical protein